MHYEWKAHNGRSFGIQHILDKTTAVNISVSFLKYLDDKEFGMVDSKQYYFDVARRRMDCEDNVKRLPQAPPVSTGVVLLYVC